MPKPDAYQALKAQLDAVCAGVSDPIAIMSTMACLLHLGFGHLWTGFYRRVGRTMLLVGPYQGTLGCLEIDIDSAEVATFDEEDQRQLESWVTRFALPGAR